MKVKLVGREFELKGKNCRKVLQSRKLLNWVERLDPEIELKEVVVEWTRINKKGLLFAMLWCNMWLDGNQIRPGLVLLSGDAVVLLPVFTDEYGKKWVELITQPRGPMGMVSLLEPIAGMVDESNDPAAVACREAYEEADVTCERHQLIDLGSIIPSGGLKSEFLHFFAVERKMKRADIMALHGKLYGAAEEGERTLTQIRSLEEISDMQFEDAKLEIVINRYEKWIRRAV